MYCPLNAQSTLQHLSHSPIHIHSYTDGRRCHLRCQLLIWRNLGFGLLHKGESGNRTSDRLITGQSAVLPTASPEVYAAIHQTIKAAAFVSMWETLHNNHYKPWTTDYLFLSCSLNVVIFEGLRDSAGHSDLRQRTYTLICYRFL